MRTAQTAHMLDRLATFVAQGGPRPCEHGQASEAFLHLYAAGVKPPQVAAIYRPTLRPDCLHGYAYLKPRGYAGDFRIIDRICTEWISPNPQLARHDEYFQFHAAPTAVRNRKAYFKNLLLQLAGRAGKRPLQVLNIGSGPARDLFEFFGEWPDAAVRVHCVDVDSGAIAYAAALCSAFADKVSFEQANALRWRPGQQYDLIWSGGLFDSLPDHWFIALVHRYLPSLAPGGELVIGNFSVCNPTRAAMELLCEWYLKHRDARKLRQLAVAAGVPHPAVAVDQEPEGVNLFLHIRPAMGGERGSE